ncbi:hypothetical protein NLM33_26200 [Bradyrhizobium sp. CCGUVB1N3]|uniref:hypothetical protein n=1 Tax=Bradyrhizobium sp. CCGUVB1N3 TaxID=2949629 RepID=UPI0020B2EC37|nr:hypothetical protein [Bradyrhizobium sp. CCGUVB1N3]MCP3473811.1 hypothetical protein [Bradyrhizobium sp. CCGUVB1N3]
MLDTTSQDAITSAAGFHLKTIEVQDLTMATVRAYRDMPASAVEREINSGHVKHLREKADAGRLVSFHWVTAEVANKPGVILRINGQHSSTMLAEMDAAIPSGLKVIREHYLCDNDDAVALLFQQWDDRKSSRSSADVAGVYQGLQEDLNDVSKPYGKLAVDGYVWFQRYVEKVPAPVGDLAYSLFSDKTLHPFIKWFGTLHNSKTRELQNKAVTAAIFGTYHANESAAKPFWEDVARGGDPDQEDLPTTTLDLWLRSIYEGTIEYDKFGSANYYQGCVYCWNLSRDNKKVPGNVKYEVKKNFALIRE